MRWGCPWGERWGEGECSDCVPFIYEDREPKLTASFPAGSIVGAYVAVDVFNAAVSQVPGLWFFGTTVGGRPTVNNC